MVSGDGAGCGQVLVLFAVVSTWQAQQQTPHSKAAGQLLQGSKTSPDSPTDGRHTLLNTAQGKSNWQHLGDTASL
jgi:hypothetical protein